MSQTAITLAECPELEAHIPRLQADGSPFDPWLRIHQRMGAEWEHWTGTRFPESGSYPVAGALEPIRIDCEHNRGRYEEPNVWVRYSIA